jgi:phage terminase small subunit
MGDSKTKRELKLEEREEIFCREYIKTLKVVKAYLCAYPDAKYDSARTQGSRMFAKPNIVQRISELIEERSERLEIDADNVLSSILDIREKCMQEKAVKDHEGKETGEYVFNASSALKANELIGRHIGMWNDKLDITSKNKSIEQLIREKRDEQKAK